MAILNKAAGSAPQPARGRLKLALFAAGVAAFFTIMFPRSMASLPAFLFLFIENRLAVMPFSPVVSWTLFGFFAGMSVYLLVGYAGDAFRRSEALIAYLFLAACDVAVFTMLPNPSALTAGLLMLLLLIVSVLAAWSLDRSRHVKPGPVRFGGLAPSLVFVGFLTLAGALAAAHYATGSTARVIPSPDEEPGPAADILGERFTNSVGMDFVRVPAGGFEMGSPPDEPGRDRDETRRRVRISSAFYIGRTEVTQAQWQKVMGSAPSFFVHCGPDCPVESVSWNMAVEFVQRLNEREHTNLYRLPTEAEWEYAARAGSGSAIYTGPMSIAGKCSSPELSPIAWFCGNSCAEYQGAKPCAKWSKRRDACRRCGPQPVSGREPNAWGLYDMLGNVWEWCADVYAPYPDGPAVDPVNLTGGVNRVLRGGAWDGQARHCRTADRDQEPPGSFKNSTGFRVARSAPRETPGE